MNAPTTDPPLEELTDEDVAKVEAELANDSELIEDRFRVDEEEEWRSLLLTKTVTKGKQEFEVVMAIAANVATILRYHSRWRGVIAYDAFSEAVVTLKAAPWHPSDAPAEVKAGEWSEGDTSRAAHWFARFEHLNVNSKIVEQAVGVVAEANVVHPVCDYLRGLKWDGAPRLDAMLHTHFGTSDTPYSRGVGSRWMISAVARVMRPGCQVDCTLLLESSKQGTGKTSGFRALVPVASWYGDSGINIGDKDSFQNLRGVWIYGLDELDSLKRGDLTRTKNFLSATRDRYRPSYGRRSRDFARQSVFCGTTNDETYLSDRTGNRRFWPNRLVRDVDVNAVVRDRDQFWAEAVHRFRAGERWHVDTTEFRDLCEAQQEERVQSDPWEPIVGAWLAKPTVRSEDAHGHVRFDPFELPSDGVLTSEVLMHALGKRTGDISRADEMRVAEALRTIGYARGPQRRENGVRLRRYAKAVTEVAAPCGDNVTTRNHENELPMSLPSLPICAHTQEDHEGSDPVAQIQPAIRGGAGDDVVAGEDTFAGYLESEGIGGNRS